MELRNTPNPNYDTDDFEKMSLSVTEEWSNNMSPEKNLLLSSNSNHKSVHDPHAKRRLNYPCDLWSAQNVATRRPVKAYTYNSRIEPVPNTLKLTREYSTFRKFAPRGKAPNSV